MNLNKIPRYTTVTNSQRAKTVNSISINWKTTDARDWTQYSLNGGAWTNAEDTVASDNKSGYYTISGLNPNTTYKVKTRCKRSDSQLYSEASEITIVTYDIAKLTSTPNVNIGSAHNVTWTNPSGTATSLKLCKTDNSTIIDYGTVTSTSKSITPTASTIYALTPNSNTYKARYIITTTANGKSYTNSKDFTFTVTNSNPTFSNFTYKDTNGTVTALTGNNQTLVKGYSNVQATISTANKATAKNSATMKKYNMLIGSKPATANYSSSADVNMSISAIDTNVIDVYAEDSRGNSTKISKTATFKNYSKIAITSLTATRQNNVGSVVTLAFKATFWNASFGSVTNAINSCAYKYKLTTASSYTAGSTTLTYSTSGNTITGSLTIKGDLGADGFNTSNSYNIQLTISDKLSTATSEVILSTGNPGIAIKGNKVAVGQPYDTSLGGPVQVNGIPQILPDGTSATEGGEIHLLYPNGSTKYAGTIIDNCLGQTRIFGIPSKDGTSQTGAGTPLIIDPYKKTITGGYTFDGRANSVGKSYNYTLGATGNVNYYTMFARTSASNATGNIGATLLVSDAGNFGGTTPRCLVSSNIK